MLDALASHLDYFTALAPLWGYVFIFAFMAIESSFIPFPSEIVMIPAGLARMPLGKFTLFTGLGAGIWTAILAAVGYALGRSAGDITYLELVHRGKAMLDANLVWILLGAALLAVSYIAVSKLVMKRTTAE